MAEIDVSLVQRLLASQFPAWASLAVRPVLPGGVDNRTFRLGDDLAVRLPSHPDYESQVAKEATWLPRIAPHLPMQIPVVVATGAPGSGFPSPWSIREWIDGGVATDAGVAESVPFACDLAATLRALRAVDATGGPQAGATSWYRGAPLQHYDEQSRRALAALGDKIPPAATAVWERALSTTWQRPAVWFHGDVASGNLLVREGRLAALIDFGLLGVGDPACDVVIAWTLLRGRARAAFLDEVDLDVDTIDRGRGWAIWQVLWKLEVDFNDSFATATLRELLAD
ncbi:MAG: aminoglycoside phosphotransferase family protein [Pseudolysinimonas sp.]|uniref:aminoglycoside phosphotransferase family protein n=1 Tax=Pseudolysinimonas sp. TaxID=2680009 RepID=UPI003263AD44